jgi:hypothetical protein
VKYYRLKGKNRKEAKQSGLAWRVDSLYNELQQFYGTQELVLKANKLDAIELMNSASLGERILALRRILSEDPTISILPHSQDLASEISELEDLFSELYTRRLIEEDLHHSIQQKMDEKHNEYIQEIKLQILKEQKSSPENAQTLKKLGRLEKMESISLSKSALDQLRPASFSEIIGQDKAIKALVAKLNTPYPQHMILYGPPGVGKTSCARLALELAKEKESSCFSKEAPFIEVDGTTLRWDPRESTNPLLGSVHDPIYQGARKDLAEEGIPEPKPGLVSEAHGGILFIDEIGEIDAALQNKLLKVKEKEALILKRNESFIGVLIDDLVNKEIDEPYRLLTSRAEYRLLLRQDNADIRLTPKGREIGLVDDRRWEAFNRKMETLEDTRTLFQLNSFTPAHREAADFLKQKGSAPLKDRISWWDLLKRPEISVSDFEEMNWIEPLDEEIAEQIQIQSKYQGYIAKQQEQVKKFEKLENRKIPEEIDYDEVYGLANEARQRLKAVRPSSMGQASRITGVNPADINVLYIFLEKKRRN